MEIAGRKRALSGGRPVFPGTGYFDTTVTGEGNGAANLIKVGFCLNPS